MYFRDFVYANVLHVPRLVLDDLRMVMTEFVAICEHWRPNVFFDLIRLYVAVQFAF